ncbi:uncharacterized protein LOC117808528 [Notolabrus celidotus]|uniref:uncharacterized protein LOC117808528 n=1 Tax=Notolabrus celidotus TaxID=1203425 RepID=UPI00148F971F|nr:uncharacterized protein LOC117808528 [Notolabrus celidotus]
MSSELAENIGRAVLDAIRSFQNAPLVAATTTQQPHRSSSASTAPGPGPSRVSTLTAQRTGTSNSTQLTPGSNFHTPNDHSDNYQGRHAISREELENVLILKTTFTEAASILGVSRPTFYKLLQDFNIPTSKFNNISDQQLDLKVSQLKTEHPNVGEVMLMGHLRSINIVVQRRRPLDCLADPYTSELITEERMLGFGRTCEQAGVRALSYLGVLYTTKGLSVSTET